jgi:uncharacterized protein YggU (UPF0235/DUF167 family)
MRNYTETRHTLKPLPCLVRLLTIKVKPNAGSSALTDCGDGSLRALLKAPPVDGRANAELVALVAARFGCPRSAVSIRSGASGRIKRVRVELPD